MSWLGVYTLCFILLSSTASGQEDILDSFIKFVDQFEKPYGNTTDEFRRRFQIFKANLKQIEVLNQPYGEGSTVFGVTALSDLSQEEFAEQYLTDLKPVLPPQSKTTLLFRSEKSSGSPGTKPASLPKKIDWRNFGVVSPVKNQGQCGACWAFATTETVESTYAIASNFSSLPVLAVQELIDCSSQNFGCNGGDICQALEYVQKNGITYGSNYPLTDRKDTCRTLSPKEKTIRIDSYTCKKYVGKEDEILHLLATRGPVAAAVDATTWNNYVGGIIQFHCYTSVNHAVEIVGYDLTGSVPYYIVRNSWGTKFGMNGYMYIKVGSNLCGIAEEVAQAKMKET